MKNIKSLILISIIGMLSFAEFAFGQAAVQDKARLLSYLESPNLAISPYAQAVPNDSYTFIGISHPSLQSAAARIGVAVEIVGMQGTLNTQAGRSSVFTIHGGETHRVFIVNQGHASINTSNAAFTDSRTHIIPTANTPQFGSVMVTTVSEEPNLLSAAATLESAVYSAGDAMAGACSDEAEMTSREGCGYSNLNQLAMWGIVYSESAGTGFAMEFIGDMHDSGIQTGMGKGDLKLGTLGAYPAKDATCSPGAGMSGVCLPSGAAATRVGAGIN
jgi:hypothetical protein